MTARNINRICQQERRRVRMKGTHIFTKITVEFVTSILLFHVVVIVLLLRGNDNTSGTTSAARYNGMYVHGRRNSQNCISQK